CMLLARASPMELAWIRQDRQPVLLPLGEAEPVTPERLLLEHVEADALDAADGAGEAAVDDLVGDADGLEDLRALVGLQRRDAHLRHDLEHPLRDALPVRGDEAGIDVDEAVLARLPQRLEREVRVDAVRAVADEKAVMVHLARLAGLDEDADARALRARDEMVVHGAAREQRADGDPVGADVAVRQHDEAIAVVDRPLGLGAYAVERAYERARRFRARERDVDRRRAPAAMVERLERLHLLVREDRMPEPQAMRLARARLEQVALGPDVALEGHDDLFADRVDRRIRDLREELLEVVVRHPRLVG